MKNKLKGNVKEKLAKLEKMGPEAVKDFSEVEMEPEMEMDEMEMEMEPEMEVGEAEGEMEGEMEMPPSGADLSQIPDEELIAEMKKRGLESQLTEIE
jgi:hypothetical protein